MNKINNKSRMRLFMAGVFAFLFPLSSFPAVLRSLMAQTSSPQIRRPLQRCCVTGMI